MIKEHTLNLQPDTRQGRGKTGLWAWRMTVWTFQMQLDMKDCYGIQLVEIASSFGKPVIRSVINNINAAVDGQHKINSILCL